MRTRIDHAIQKIRASAFELGLGLAALTLTVGAAEATNNSQFISQTTFTTMNTGEVRQVSVTFKNTGTTTWTQASLFKLGSRNPAENTNWGMSRVLLSSADSIAPGQQKTFTFNITAPTEPGLYNFQWQMLKEGVNWFGPSSTNQLIQVGNGVNASQFISQSVPTTIVAGQSQQVSVTFKNTGNTTWTRANLFKLGSRNPGDNTRWGMSRVELSSADSISPGQQKTFTFNITAPTIPGSYDFQWQMLKEGVNWFGPSSTNLVIQVSEGVSASQFISQTNLSSMNAGETRQVSVTFKNTGTSTWTRAGLFRLGSRNPADNTHWGMSRVFLSTADSIAPQQQKTFTFTITAPTTPGLYNFQWRMLKEGVNWFGANSTNQLIQVGQGTNASQFISQNVPAVLTPGETRSVSITFKNTGNTTWTRTGLFKLGSRNPADNTTWGMSRVELSAADSIGPNQQKTFTFDITAPTAQGFHNFQWRMLQEGVNWFGADTTNVAIYVATPNASQFISQSVPSSMTPGETRQVSVTFKNTGSATWTRAQNYKLGSRNPNNNTTWGLNRALLAPSDSIAPNQQKAFTFNITAPSTPGPYNFQWRMVKGGGGGWFGPNTPNKVISVVEPTPRIDSLDQERVSLGTITTMVVRGANLTEDSFYIPAYVGSGRTEPAITSVTISNGGTRADVRVDATSAATEGVWMLAAQNGEPSSEEEVTAIDFRVVANGPVIDAWTPSEPIAGGYSALLIAGANLQGANVISTHPGVIITDLDNGDDDALSGFLSVQAGVDPQLISLIVENHGVVVTLEPEIIDPFRAPLTHRMVSESPPVYVQDMTFNVVEDQTLAPQKSASFCLFNYTRVRFSREFSLQLTLLDGSGTPDPDPFSGLEVGETRPFGVLTVVVAAQLFIAVTFDFCDEFGFQFCFGGSIGIVVPGMQGTVTDFSCCFPGGCSLPSIRSTTGTLNSVSIRTSPEASDCVTLRRLSTPADGGRQSFEIEVLDCCSTPPPILLSLSGQAFGGTSLSVAFSFTDIPLGVARIDDTQCQWNKLVVFRAFIPWAHGEPPFPSAQSPTGFLIGPGDDRFCSDLGTSFRVQQIAPLTETGIQGLPINQAMDTLLFLWDPIANQPGLPFINLTNDASGMVLPNAQVAPDGSVVLSLQGSSPTSAGWFAFPPVPPALTPRIDWCLDLRIRRENDGRISYSLTGGHDNYPAYEVFVGNQRIYCWEPSTNFVGLLLGGCSDVPVNVSGFCD